MFARFLQPGCAVLVTTVFWLQRKFLQLECAVIETTVQMAKEIAREFFDFLVSVDAKTTVKIISVAWRRLSL